MLSNELDQECKLMPERYTFSFAQVARDKKPECKPPLALKVESAVTRNVLLEQTAGHSVFCSFTPCPPKTSSRRMCDLSFRWRQLASSTLESSMPCNMTRQQFSIIFTSHGFICSSGPELRTIPVVPKKKSCNLEYRLFGLRPPYLRICPQKSGVSIF